MENLRERRKFQLDKEEAIDKSLATYYKDCPSLIYEYLSSCREINRKLSNVIYKEFSLFQSYNNYLRSLDTVDVLQEIDLKGNIR
jgi:hypothetical protein